MIKVVRCLASINLSKASCTTPSLSVSKALVASSNRRITGARTSARAMAMRCFCPPLSCAPRSPTSVRYFSGKSEMKVCAFDCLAAFSICWLLMSPSCP
mmetsp:Transcript_78905/g.198284  ORF Transcript_78905/g.198284 Transcript_78905/m.198284 type:complete len:99 (-) Transcript_78905:228-524(-)